MTSNIDATIFLPGHIADGTESIDIPMMSIEQIRLLINLYEHNYYRLFFPYLSEVLILLRSEHVDDTLPLITKWIPVVRNRAFEELDVMICLLLFKYGWNIPQNVFDRVARYAEFMVSLRGTVPTSSRSYPPPISQDNFELSRTICQLGQHHYMDHLLYIAHYCINIIERMPKLKTKELIELSLNEVVPRLPASYAAIYMKCVMSIVDICVLASYLNVHIEIPEKILNSDVFRTCLLQQHTNLLHYYCGSISAIDRFHASIGRKLPEYDNNEVLLALANKAHSSNYFDMAISMIGIPEIKTIHNKSVLGMNPAISEYEGLLDRSGWTTQAWYCSGLACSSKLRLEDRQLVLKLLCAIWRIHINNTYISLGFIVEIARRINTNSDEILESTFSMRMTNVSWALKDMPRLYETGLQIGPHTIHMINMFAIKHAAQSQSVIGLQKMMEVLDGQE